MDTFIKDLRYGIRMMGKNRAFTAVAVIALALGIGANTAIFSTIDALLLRPFNFPELDRLVSISETVSYESYEANTVAPADYLDWKRESSSFEELAAFHWWGSNLTGEGEPERVESFKVSSNFFATLGVEAALGRAFSEDEEQPGSTQVAVISHTLWQRRFAADSAIIGKRVSLDGAPFTIVGVMPRDFNYPHPTELWVPLSVTNEFIADRQEQYLFVVGRLKADVSLDQARSEMKTIAARIEQEYPQTNTNRAVRAELLRDKAQGDFTPMFLWTLMGAVTFVLMIASVNVANMQLARATARHKEIAIRSALGATRMRVIRQLLTENILLSLMGGTAGILMALWMLDLIKSSIPPEITRFIPGWQQMSIDARALLFTFAAAILTGILFGLAPAFQASKSDLNETLKEGGKGASAGAGRHRLRSLLVIMEVALALVLLVGAGLMVKGFARMIETQKKGFDSENVLTMRVSLTESRYKEPHRITDFYKQAVEKLGSLAGVASASAVRYVPGSGGWDTIDLLIEGRPAPAPGEEMSTNFQTVSPGYFQTMRIPLVDGRDFASSDDADHGRVAIISSEFVRRHFPSENPVGKKVRVVADKSEWATVIGVVGDVKRFMFDRQVMPTLYLPLYQTPARSMSLAIRTTVDPQSLVAASRSQIHSVDRDQSVYEIKTIEQIIAEQYSGVRLAAMLMALFGIIALALSAVGVYAVIAYSVQQRTHEIGVRMALGASSGDVLRMVVGNAVTLAVAGLGLGLPAALALGSLLASALWGMVALDVTTFVAITLLLVGVAILSSYIPARKAARIDPMIALRYE